jgi:RHS repeat-associated protein
MTTDRNGNVIQQTHYYPFCLTMGSIGTGQGVQLYKFTDKELDMEHGMNLYDFEARTYDPATGRFLSIDPMAEKYYNISPYAYCANDPLLYIDPTGEDIKIFYYDDKGKQQSFVFNGNNAADAPENQFVNDFISAYNYNVENGGGDNLKAAATSTDYTIQVIKTSKHSERKNLDTGKPQTEPFVRWNPNEGLEMATDGKRYSPATILEHEFDHAIRYETGDYREYEKDTERERF